MFKDTAEHELQTDRIAQINDAAATILYEVDTFQVRARWLLRCNVVETGENPEHGVREVFGGDLDAFVTEVRKQVKELTQVADELEAELGSAAPVPTLVR